MLYTQLRDLIYHVPKLKKKHREKHTNLEKLTQHLSEVS